MNAEVQVSATQAPGKAAAARHIAVVGGGWAGLSAAVHARRAGHRVSLFEMARQMGGRARSLAPRPVDHAPWAGAETGADPGAKGWPDTGHNPGGTTAAEPVLDNGQHVLIGACGATLELMRAVGVDPAQVLRRQPLALCRADGRGLRLRPGPAAWAFATAVLRCQAWTVTERLQLLARCARWAGAGLRCAPERSVDDLCAGLPLPVRQLLIDPLCVAALNTPTAQASAEVFLRVLRDGLLGGPGASDLLLPQRPLHELLPTPAARWLAAQGATLRLGQRVQTIEPRPRGFAVDGQPFDGVVLACPALEAARLAEPVAPAWATQARALRFEPIVTVYAQCQGLRLPLPMLALAETAAAPAQFVFDHGHLQGPAGRCAFVISGAAPWVQRGLHATAQAVLAQAAAELAPWGWRSAQARVLDTIAERRATFRCAPGLQRPPAAIAPGLLAAGDYVHGPYPATLEGAVRAGAHAAWACAAD